MQRKWKITLGIGIPIIVIGSFLGGLALNSYLRDRNQTYNDDDPVLLFPVEMLENLEMLYAFDMTPGIDHNGIDFIINATTNIIASCNMTCYDIVSGHNVDAGFWYAGVSFTINDAFELLIGFENFNDSGTADVEQLNALNVDIGQVVTQGEVIGQLLYLSSGTHIHYSLQKNGEALCPYLFFSPEAKVIFDSLWSQIGSSTNPCNGSLNCF